MLLYDKEALAAAAGRTPAAITGMEPGSDNTRVTFTDGSALVLRHQPDCCESVTIEDVAGDPADLIGHPLALCSEETGEPGPEPEYVDSLTWSFYKFGGLGGYVTLRWLGESNGYYSETVHVEFEQGAQ